MDLLPAGKWLARPVQQTASDGSALNCIFGESQKKRTPQVTVQFEITAGPASGQTVFWTGYFSDGAKANTIKGLRAIGFRGDDMDLFNDQDPLTLNTVELTIDHETDDRGRKRAKVNWVNRPRASMDRSQLSQLSSMMRDSFAQFQ